MEIVEHLVMDDLVAIGDELCVVENLLVRNKIFGVESLAYVVEELHISIDMEFFVASVDSLVADVDEDLLMKHYVQFVPGSEHVHWMIEIFVFDSVMQMWMICMLVFLSLLEWKPLVKMKMVEIFLWASKWGTNFSIYLGSMMQEHLGFVW